MSSSGFSYRPPPREEEFIPSRNSFVNKEDLPIRPLRINFNEIPGEYIEPAEAQPKFSNFLKKSRQNINKPQEEKTIEKEVYEEFPPENLEEDRQDEPRNIKPKDFLKRKSRAVRPQKLEWKVTKRIDCWLPREKYPKQKENNIEIRQMIPRGNFMSLRDIEGEFQKDLNSFQRLDEFFLRGESGESKVPQLDGESQYVQEYSDEMYQKIIEELEKHYNYLCSEDVLNN